MDDEPEFQRTFIVDGETNTSRSYKEFIESLRQQLAERYSHNCPVLRRQHDQPTGWFHVVLETITHQRVTLSIRLDNLFLDGYRMNNGQWLEFRGQRHFIPGSTFLPFDGVYAHMATRAGVNLVDINLGQQTLAKAVYELAQSTDNTRRARMLIVVIQMICESIRFDRIFNRLVDTYRSNNGQGQPITSWMDTLEHSWGDISSLLLLADAYGNDSCLIRKKLKDLAEKLKEMINLETVWQLTDLVGILKGFWYDGNEYDSDGRRSTVRRMAINYEPSFPGQPMVEVFSVCINNIDEENHVDLYGTIKFDDGLGSVKLYDQDSEDHQDISPGDTILLTGPTERAISANDSFTINLHLMDYDCLSPEDEVSNGEIEWNVYNPDNDYDLPLYDNVDGTYASVTVNYVVMRIAVQAKIEVILINYNDENPADIYGVLTARSDKFVKESVLFKKKQKEHIDVHPGDAIPLSRSIVAVPLHSYLIVGAELYDYDENSPDDEIANGVANFNPRSSGTFHKYIYGKYEKVQVKVTWNNDDESGCN